MSRQAWPAVGALLAAAAAAAVPARAGRRRRARVVFGGETVGSAGGRRAARHPRYAIRRLGEAPGTPAAAAVLAGVPALLAGGPVAAVLAAVYAALAVRGARRHALARRNAAERARAVDALGALAADLRAGLPPTPVRPESADPLATPAAWRATATRRLVARAAAAVRLAEDTGAPLADLVERVEADARATDRAVAAAAAQAAGARFTAWLLAALPLGGIGLGYGVGVDPLHVLLRTRVGAGCALVAVLLQVGGLAWADRLARGWTDPPGREARPS